jgi:beta-galactosidase
LAARLLAYVQQGGHLVLGPRSGMKDEYNALNVQRQPGPLVEPLGGRVEQFYALEAPVPVSGAMGAGTAQVWAEQLSTRADGAEVLLRYGKANGWLDGQPAMISHRVGKGRMTYLGAVLDPALMRSVLQWLSDDAGVKPEFGPLPQGVELSRRVAQDRAVYVFTNHGAEAQEIALPNAMRDVLHDGHDIAKVVLEPQGVAVLETGAH